MLDHIANLLMSSQRPVWSLLVHHLARLSYSMERLITEDRRTIPMLIDQLSIKCGTNGGTMIIIVQAWTIPSNMNIITIN